MSHFVKGLVFLIGAIPLIQKSEGRINKFVILYSDAFEPAENELIFEIIALFKLFIFILHILVPFFEYLEEE